MNLDVDVNTYVTESRCRTTKRVRLEKSARSLNGISIDGLSLSNCYSLSGTAACGPKLEQFNEILPKKKSKANQIWES